MDWETIYNTLGIKDFVYFISSPQIQDTLFPVKLIFVFFSMFFLFFVIYFMMNSSWLQYKFLEDVTEFFSWQAYGSRQMVKEWEKIKKKASSGLEADYKLAIIDAEDFLMEVLDNAGYEGKDFADAVESATRLLGPTTPDIMKAHETRNAIVYNPNFKITTDEAEKVLSIYEKAAKNVGMA